MEKDADGRLLVVVDSSFLINFLAINRMDILGGVRQFKFHIANHVKAEILKDEQPMRLEAAIAASIITEIEITDLDEVGLYDEVRKVLDDGEAASLAIAVRRRWVIAADERGRFRKELFARLGEDYLLDTPGALVASIKSGVIGLEEAEIIREQLRENRFEMDRRPFEELTGEG